MPTNLELKVKLRNFSKAMEVAKTLNESIEPLKLEQVDTFYNCTHGRLKLRLENNEKARLIEYEREDTSGTKRSDFTKIPIQDPDALNGILTRSLGKLQTVTKTRFLYLVEYYGLVARIHLDQVHSLGNFIEFEVLLSDELSDSELKLGEEMILYLKDKFEIQDSDLVSGAYADLLLEKLKSENEPVPADGSTE